MSEPTRKQPSTQSDRAFTAEPDAQAALVREGTAPPSLEQVASTVAEALARISELEHRIYLLEGRSIDDDERNP